MYESNNLLSTIAVFSYDSQHDVTKWKNREILPNEEEHSSYKSSFSFFLFLQKESYNQVENKHADKFPQEDTRQKRKFRLTVANSLETKLKCT